MASLGKKILSAFVEINDEEKKEGALAKEAAYTPPASVPEPSVAHTGIIDEKFKQYFNKLFTEANIPGPDYYEFSKMIAAMQSIADEKARYSAAFAGLGVQGLDKQKLLSTAAQYIEVINNDAVQFDTTVDAALQEKVHQKQQAITQKQQRIEQLSKEMAGLQQEITTLQQEITENEQKIQANTGGYKTASAHMKNQIKADIEKIKQYIS